MLFLAFFFFGFASNHLQFSKTLAYLVSIILIYFFVIKHPVWGSIWFLVVTILTSEMFWPGLGLFNLGLEKMYEGKATSVQEREKHLKERAQDAAAAYYGRR